LTNSPQFWKYWHLKDIDIATTSVRLNQDLIDKATIMARALNRALSKQTERWAKLSEMIEDDFHPPMSNIFPPIKSC
jgi:hypothetical protein